MKNLFILFLFSLTSTYAQIEDRVMVKGQIIIDDDSANLENIDIYNINTAQGTTTGREGEFLLPMAIGEQVQVSSVQFQTVTIKITKAVTKNQKLTVRIDEDSGITELEEVVVKPYNLSGDVQADVAKINTEDITTIGQSSEELTHDPDNGYEDDEYSKVENASMESNILKNGLNFANIFRAIFKNKSDRNLSSQEMTTRLRQAFNDDFFQEYLDIEKDQIPNFIYYVEGHGLEKELLKKDNELDFIQFLIDKSKTFKQQ
jgi:5'(3')-deoxyribonucleotidase